MGGGFAKATLIVLDKLAAEKSARWSSGAEMGSSTTRRASSWMPSLAADDEHVWLIELNPRL